MARTGRIRFEVYVSAPSAGIARDRTRVGGGMTEATALRKACEVIQQWAASEGAITPGTIVSIVDTNDGGNLFTAEYLGYEVPLLGRNPNQWPGQPKESKSHPLRKWPR